MKSYRILLIFLCFPFLFGFSYTLNSSKFLSTELPVQSEKSFSISSFFLSILHSNFISNNLNISLFSSNNLKTYGQPLNYQNPFSFSEGTIISFFLNDVTDSLKFSISIFNIFGEKIKEIKLNSTDFNKDITQDINGETFYNYKYSLESRDFDYKTLTPGVYFYIIQSNDFFIGKGKMGVIP